MRHLIRGLGLALMLLVATFYPFLPGDSDRVAHTVSITAQFAVLAGMLFLVPLGLGRIVTIAWSRRRSADATTPPLPRAMRVLAWLAGSASALIVALGAWIGGSALASWVIVGTIGTIAWRKRGHAAGGPGAGLAAAMACVAVPIVALTLHLAFVGHMASASRTRAMNRASELITALERHHASTGTYADTLVALWPDYKTGIIGIQQFDYARHGQAYTLSFSQPALVFPNFGTEEIVAYNPRDEHRFPSHAAWAVERSDDQRMANQGWYSARDAGAPHWKILSFD